VPQHLIRILRDVLSRQIKELHHGRHRARLFTSPPPVIIMRGLYILLSLAASSLAAPAFSERAVCTFVCPTQDKLGGALVGATISLLGILDCTYVGLPSSVSCTYIGVRYFSVCG
jgi:hypothetical protein